MSKAGLQDTLSSITGKIIDSITNEPIPFATITFYKDGSVRMTIVSNGEGEFSTDVKQLKSKVDLAAIGYQKRTCYLAFDHSNLLRLISVASTLPDVVVSGRAKLKPNAEGIIKKVNKYIEQNYSGFSFDQKFKIYSTTRNYDSIKGEMTDLIDLRFYNDRKLPEVRKWPQHIANFDSVFFNCIGVPRLSAGYIAAIADVLRMGLVFDDKHSRNFDFRLLKHCQDQKYGTIYLVSFKGYTFEDQPVGYLKGEILIREDDYAVVSLKYNWEWQVAGLNRSLEQLYHSPTWKANRVGKIVSNSITFKHEYSYAKDTVTGKYRIQTIKADCYQTGYQIENNRKMQLYYQFDATSLGLKLL